MSRMSTRSIFDSLEVRKQEIFMSNPNPSLETFSGNLFLAYFAKFKFWVTRIREKLKEPLIIFESWQNMFRMSSSSFLDSFQVPKQEMFMSNLNRLLEILSRKAFLGLFR